ncbi:tetratricopeptide repeat-containing protein [Cystoisospora suis]|uniref:Tetratricopeptide repeat-containing protein n=1 Tax=Cystoisospora suis TaxID=483139 RepID=A0A2C6L7P9_9APIC|nr:tetratricopeptide repeat-containing protein [Cystoisospora suis]
MTASGHPDPAPAAEAGEGEENSASVRNENAAGTADDCTESPSRSTPDQDEAEDESEGDDDVRENEDNEFEGKRAETLLEEGKSFFRRSEWTKAAEYFSRAVERKVAELGGQDFHSDMSPYYLWFGDTLLTKEEQNAELFQFTKKTTDGEADSSAANAARETTTPSISTSSLASGASSSSSSTASPSQSPTPAQREEEVPRGDAAGKVSDEELAFEMLEMAKKCLSMKLGESSSVSSASSSPQALLTKGDATESERKNQQNKGETKQETETDLALLHTDVIDLSFAYVRLADMQLMNERYDDAALDYRQAVELRERYKLPEETLMAPLLSLAQATFFSGNKHEALNLFNRTLSVGQRIKEGALEMPKSMTLTTLNDTLEDLRLQITDIEKQIADEKISPPAQSTKGSQCSARDCIATTTSTFDAAQLDASAAKVIKVSVRPQCAAVSVINVASSQPRSQQDEEERFRHSPKKRRIDLRQIQATSTQPAATTEP